MSELDKISQEYSGMYGGDDNFRKIYQKATENRYDFLFLDLQENPARAFRNFEQQIAEGDRLLFGDTPADTIPGNPTEEEVMPQ
jgi:hypothetical protein